MEHQETVIVKTIKLPQVNNRSRNKESNLVNDKQLWSEFRKGNEAAFIKIYNNYFEELCNFGVQFTSIEMVEDAIQDLYIDLRNKRTKLPELQKSIKLFLFQCLKRRIYNVLKSQKRIQYVLRSEHIFDIVPHFESEIILNQEYKEKLQKLDAALKGLNEKQREAIYYYFYKGMGYEEVKVLLNFKDVKSARNLIYKVIKALRKSFLFFF